ncbi:MAG: TMEM175 family protein [Thermoplasmata archaeon]
MGRPVLEDPERGTRTRYEGISGEGTDLGRILALSDGVFAFALTFLVINLALPTVGAAQMYPTLAGYLGAEWGRILDYALAFMIVASWWNLHHRIFSAIRRYDAMLVRLNHLLLLLISITPFALAIVFEYGPLTPTDTAVSAKGAVALFGVLQTLTSLGFLGIWWHATRRRHLVDPDLPRAWIDHAERQSLFRVGIMAAAVGIALLLPFAGELAWGAVILQRRATRPPSLEPPATERTEARET